MDLLNVTDSELISHVQKLASEERRITAEILEHLKEVERRALYLAHRYGSLLEWCVQVLKYSESAAYRRISAMRLMKDLAEVKKKIEVGALTLSKPLSSGYLLTV